MVAEVSRNDFLVAEGPERCLKLNGFTIKHQAALTLSILSFQLHLQCFLLKADLAKMLPLPAVQQHPTQLQTLDLVPALHKFFLDHL